jgi:hypothetical protein
MEIGFAGFAGAMVKPGRCGLRRAGGSGGLSGSEPATGTGPDDWPPMTVGFLPLLAVSSEVAVLSLGDDSVVVSAVVPRSAVRSGFPGWGLCARGCWGPPDCFDGSGVEALGAPGEPTCWGPREPSDLELPPEGGGSSARAIPLANPTVTQVANTNAETANSNHQ